jgi:hypothetical protein
LEINAGFQFGFLLNDFLTPALRLQPPIPDGVSPRVRHSRPMLRRLHGTITGLVLLGATSTGLQAEDSKGSTPSTQNTGTSNTTSTAAAPPSVDVDSPATPTPTNGNPFRLIAARNAFGIKDPPLPPEPVVDTPPPPPPTPSNVTLTGFSLWQGRKKVYLQISAPGSKAPSYHDMEEGDVQDDIEILSIDEKNETAKIRNAGQEFTLNFKENGAKPSGAPGAPSQPGAPGTIPAPVTTGVVNANRGVGGPTVIGRGGVTDSASPTGNMAVPAMVGASGGDGGGVAAPASGGIYPTLPSRRQRTDGGGTQTPSSAPVVQPGQERVINGRVIPPPPPLPVFDAPVGE